jgi:hypothetical protein
MSAPISPPHSSRGFDSLSPQCSGSGVCEGVQEKCRNPRQNPGIVGLLGGRLGVGGAGDPAADRDLFLEAGPWGERTKLWQAFLDFDTAHPDIWRLFEKLTLQLLAQGKNHYSADAILHVVRFHYDTSTSGECPKINNNFSACYSRKWAMCHPRQSGFFERRKSKADYEVGASRTAPLMAEAAA